jgi:hypothetical protein
MTFLIDYNEEENIYDNISQLKDDFGYEMKKDNFNDALRAAKSKFNSFCKNYNNQNSNLIENIQNKNIHTQYIFKNKNLNRVDDIINDEATINELCKNLSNKKYKKSNSYIDNNNEETKDTDKQKWGDFENKIDNKDYFDMKMNNYSTFETKVSNHEKIENIYEFTQIKKNNNNHDLVNQNNNVSLLGKKRNNDCSYIRDANNLIDEIKNLYNIYNKEKKDQQSEEYKIYEEDVGFFKKDMTIIENKKGICTIYIEKKVIIDIYLIKEKMFVSDKDDIMHILNTLKQNIQKKLK